MASDTRIILATLIIIIAILAAVAGYLYYDNMQKEKEAQQKQMEELQKQLNETQDELNELNNSKSSSSGSSSSKASSSSGNKVTYEEAGVDKSIGYIKTCKYPGCGARYDSSLSYCPKCGHKNIYV